MSAPFARRRPQSERTVDVYPRAMLLRDRDQRFKLIIRARVDITRLQEDDRRRAGRFRQLRRKRSRDQFAVVVHRQVDDVRMAQAKQTNGAFKRSVTLIAGNDANGRRAVQSLAFDVSVTLRQQRVPRSGETRHVRHLASGDDREAGVRRQSENFFEPFADGLFDDRRGGTGRIERGVLLPR